jgi:hypothetical protein
MTSNSQNSEENADMILMKYLMSRMPDARQMSEIISQSHEYIKTLPLSGINENYVKNYPDLFEPVM